MTDKGRPPGRRRAPTPEHAAGDSRSVGPEAFAPAGAAGRASSEPIGATVAGHPIPPTDAGLTLACRQKDRTVQL
jgi:hypothetical protein